MGLKRQKVSDSTETLTLLDSVTSSELLHKTSDGVQRMCKSSGAIHYAVPFAT